MKQDVISDEEKLFVIESLLNYVDPETGEVLEEDHLVHQDAVKEVLLTAQKAIVRKQQREKNKKPSTGVKWTDEEDEQLRKEYNNKLTVSEIADIHGRSIGSINSRLIKLSMIEIE